MTRRYRVTVLTRSKCVTKPEPVPPKTSTGKLLAIVYARFLELLLATPNLKPQGGSSLISRRT
jgi:hypothetical protein